MTDVEKVQPDILTSGVHKSASPAIYGITPASPVTTSVVIANPGPLGLFSLATTAFILSMYIVNARGVHEQNVAVGMAIFCGGLGMIISGMWAFPCGNVLGATANVLFGTLFLSYATILIPGSGVIAAFQSETELANAIGIYFMAWMIVTILFLIVALRTNVAFVAMFTCVAFLLLLLGIAEFTASTAVTKAGGAFGIMASLIAYYSGLAELLNSQPNPVFKLPLFPL